MSEQRPPDSVSLSELPHDELVAYGESLGLELDSRIGRGEALRLVRERQELLVELDRDALLDIVVWGRRPVRQSAGKEELAKQIAAIHRADFTGLSHRGLVALARLRGLAVGAELPTSEIEAALRRAEGFWGRARRRRRRLVGAIVARLAHEDKNERGDEYRFLPEAAKPSLKTHIEEEGMVGGIARRLRGVADDYVREKLDEIEVRIDRKLDEIDRRMAEWRDREVSNRLKILKITLIVSILVALLGLGYDCVRSKSRSAGESGTPSSSRAEVGDGVQRPAGEAGGGSEDQR